LGHLNPGRAVVGIVDRQPADPHTEQYEEHEPSADSSRAPVRTPRPTASRRAWRRPHARSPQDRVRSRRATSTVPPRRLPGHGRLRAIPPPNLQLSKASRFSPGGCSSVDSIGGARATLSVPAGSDRARAELPNLDPGSAGRRSGRNLMMIQLLTHDEYGL
jgi:hypothetical protein